MQFWFANVGLTIVIALQIFAQAFELSAPDVFKVDTIGSRGRGLVEKYRDAVASPYFVADSTGERDAIVERHAFDRNKRNDIGRANARMRALMDRQVNELSGFSYTE